MPINDPRQAGYVTHPRIKVLSGGVEIPQAASMMVASNNQFQADRFSLAFAPTLNGVGSFRWWSQQTSIPVEIQVGFPTDGNASPTWKTILVGEADKITMDINRFLVDIEGRDLTGKMIDQKSSASYANQSSAEIVKTIAASHGLTAEVSTSSGLVGRFWDSDRETSSLNQSSAVSTDWDMIVTLAKKEGYDAYVEGSTLHFKPQTDASADPYVWLHEIDSKGRQMGNVHNLKMDRVLTVAKGLHVTVKSWHAKLAKGFSKTSSTAASIGSDGRTKPQEYILQHPNMTEDEAQDYADKVAAEFALHEMLIEANLPGDLLLTPRVVVKLQGTGTDFDQIYYPASIVKEITVQSGFVMRVACKNRAVAKDQATSANKPASITAPAINKPSGIVARGGASV